MERNIGEFIEPILASDPENLNDPITIKSFVSEGLRKGSSSKFNHQVCGEITTKNFDGKSRSKDTILTGNDPNPPKGKEH